jgi:hypothetical protein
MRAEICVLSEEPGMRCVGNLEYPFLTLRNLEYLKRVRRRPVILANQQFLNLTLEVTQGDILEVRYM